MTSRLILLLVLPCFVVGCAKGAPIGASTHGSGVDLGEGNGGAYIADAATFMSDGAHSDGAVAGSGCTALGNSGVIDAASGQCVFRVCASSTECTTKALPIGGIGARPLDGRFPVTATITNVSLVTATYQAVSIPNATNLCAKYGAGYWAHVRRADVPSCGYNYGLTAPSGVAGAFDAADLPLCSLAYASVFGNASGVPDASFSVTGIPIIEAVWCKKAADTTGGPGTVTPPAFGSYNALPFDTDPHDNSDPRYQPAATGGNGV